jgi:site-specific recombinase XerD
VSGRDDYPALRLGDLLRETVAAYVSTLRSGRLSEAYLGSVGTIVEEFAGFCDGEETGGAWQLRQRYLAQRVADTEEFRFSTFYLYSHGKELRRFVSWYAEHAAATGAPLGELSGEQLSAYWSRQTGVLPYRQEILNTHLPMLPSFLARRCGADPGCDPVALLDDYFEERRQWMQARDFGASWTRRTRTVTRRHLIWLECRGRLPAGSAVAERDDEQVWRELRELAPGEKSPAQALAEIFVDRVDRGLPPGLRQPLIEYLEHLVHERALTHCSVRKILRTTQALCRLAAGHGLESFEALTVAHLDEVISSLVGAPTDDLLRRREQVRDRNGELRGFLRYLHRRGNLDRALAGVLISPPCYRATRPPTVLSEAQVRHLLASVDRDAAGGRRCYAILLLMSTYGLRPADVAGLRLDMIDWRRERIALVQNKTGDALTLPLVVEVAQVLYAYLRRDRPSGGSHRHVFLASCRPHRPLRSQAILRIVKNAMCAADLGWASARHLRTSVATHLLRQGEALSTIQEILGHRTAVTTQRYARTDVELLRAVIEESER